MVGIGRRADRGEQIAAELRADGLSMTSVAGDVSDPADCQRFIEVAIGEHGRLDALVNNVGGAGTPTYVPTDEVTPDAFDAGIAATSAAPSSAPSRRSGT